MIGFEGGCLTSEALNCNLLACQFENRCSFCRSLRLDSSSAAFMALAGPQLQSLDASSQSGSSDGWLPDFAEMTAMTSLELSGYHFSAEIPPLQGSLLPNLVKLSLHNCKRLPQCFIRAGALTSLGILEIIGDVSFHHEHQSDDAAAAVEVQRLKSLGDTVINLPELTYISGNSNLFHCGMVDSLREWNRGQFKTEGTDSASQRFWWDKSTRRYSSKRSQKLC